jgi:hypothetical protein
MSKSQKHRRTGAACDGAAASPPPDEAQPRPLEFRDFVIWDFFGIWDFGIWDFSMIWDFFVNRDFPTTAPS